MNDVSDRFEDSSSQPENIECDLNAVDSLTNISYASAVNTETKTIPSRSQLKIASNIPYKRKKKTRSELILPQMDADLQPTREVHFERPLKDHYQNTNSVLSCPELTKSKLELLSEVKITDSQNMYSTKKIHRAVNALEENSKTSSSNSIYSDEYCSISNYSTEISTQTSNLKSSLLFTDSKGCQTSCQERFDRILIRKLHAENRILKNLLDENAKNLKEVIEQNEDLMSRNKMQRNGIRNKITCKLERKKKRLTSDITEKTSYRYHETYRVINY